jgi:hypothetical protein
MGWVVTSEKDTRYPLYRRLGGLQGRSGRVRKISPPRGNFFPNCFSCSLFVLFPYLLLCLDCPDFFLFLYSTIYTTQTSMPPAGFEPAIAASAWPQTLAIDCSATGIRRSRSLHRPASSESLFCRHYTDPLKVYPTEFRVRPSVRF